MFLETRHLELVEAVVEAGTVTAAAERLHVTQPAITQRLRSLEEYFGGSLFKRTGRRMEATRLGLRLLQTARRNLPELRAAEQDLRNMAAGRLGILRLSSQCSTNYSWFPPLLRRFRERYPKVELRIVNHPGLDPVSALHQDRLDVALVTEKCLGPGARVRATELFEDELVALVHEDHPWARREWVEGLDFADQRLLMFEAYDPSQPGAPPLPIPDGVQPASLTTLPMVSELLVEMVAARQGITIAARWLLEPYLDHHPLALVRLTREGQKQTWYAATREERGADFRRGLIELLSTVRPSLQVSS